MTPYLLDANVVIAIAVGDHEHHDRASDWAATAGRVALCPIVEGALARFLIRVGETSSTVTRLLEAFHESQQCDFWEDSISYSSVDLATVSGHRQVTDTYLAALAASRGGRLATFDRALATAHPRSTLLIPEGS